MRSVKAFTSDARRIVATIVSGAVALFAACSTSTTTSTRSAKPVHCSSDVDCSKDQWCNGDTCTAIDTDSGAPPKAKSGTGGSSSSSTCGNGVAEGHEACDGSDLKNETCATATMNPAIRGTLACTSSCTFDLRGCKLSADAGTGRGGTFGGFGGAGTGGTFGGFGGGTGGFIGFADSGTYTPAPPIAC